jgi:hypothetical protein
MTDTLVAFGLGGGIGLTITGLVVGLSANRLARVGSNLEPPAGPRLEVPALMTIIGANVGVLSRPATHDHRLSAKEHDHCLSAERIATAAAALCAFVSRYVDLLADEVSPADRRRLSETTALMERACDSADVASGALREK